MGNYNPRPLLRVVKLQVKVDKQFYHAGEEVSGKIIMNVEQTVTYDHLKINLQGHSYKNWGANSSRIQLIDKRDRKEEFENETIVTQFNKPIQPGRYVFLFALTLRQELPKIYSSTNSDQFTNSFQLKASLIGSREQYDDIQCAYYVVITQPIQFKKKKFSFDLKSNLKVCKCFRSGETQVKIALPKNNVKTGELFQIFLDINNKSCKYDIENITLNLYQYSYKIGDGGKFRFYRAVKAKNQTQKIIAGMQQSTGLSITVPPNLRYSTYFGIQKGYYYMIGIKINYENPLVTNTNQEQIYEHIFVQSQKNEMYSGRKLSHILIQSNTSLFQGDRQRKYVEPSK